MHLEDCHDFFAILFNTNKYELVIELDHSQAHKQYAPDAFTIDNFNLGPGGKVSFIKNITI